MDQKAKHKTLRLFSSGMYVLTSRSGDHYGAATVTWVSQASFRPPLIMVAIKPDSNVFECLCESRVAILHVLGSAQHDIARKFFSTTERVGDMINDEPFVPGKTSAPVLVHAPAFVECCVRAVEDHGGDHTIVVLEVVEAEFREAVEPLTIAGSPWEYGG